MIADDPQGTLFSLGVDTEGTWAVVAGRGYPSAGRRGEAVLDGVADQLRRRLAPQRRRALD